MKPLGSSRDDALKPEDLKALEAATSSPREKALVRLMTRFGLRAGEAAHVNLSWISGQRGTLEIPYVCSCARCKESGDRWGPKTEAGARTVPLRAHTETWEAVKIYLTHEDEPWVTRQGVWALVKRVADRGNLLERVYPHALRATAATQLADMGLSADQIALIMGWEDSGMAKPYIQRSGIDAEKALKGKDLEWW